MFCAKSSELETRTCDGSDSDVMKSSQAHISHGTALDVSKSLAHMAYGPDPDELSAVYFGEMKSWDGPTKLSIPDGSSRYKSWQSLPYMATNSTGFNNDCVDHTFKWDKTNDSKEIVFAITWKGRVGYLLADGESTDKPYIYTSEDIESPEGCYKLKIKSTGSTFYSIYKEP